MSAQLSEDQIDVLKEIFNLGMGKALKALSRLTGEDQEITFELPSLSLISFGEFRKQFVDGEDNVFISQKYGGRINGESLMFFRNTKKNELARILIDSSLPVEEISHLESDALIELGNIFINAAISCLGDFLEIEIQTEIPELLTDSSVSDERADDSVTIYLESIFKVGHMNIEGCVSFLVNNDTIEILKNKIDESF